MNIQIQSSRKDEKKTATKTTDAHFNLPSVPTMHMFKYHWLLWDRMGKNEKKFKFRNNKKHSAWTHRTSERLILFFCFFFSMHAAFQVFTDLQPQWTHANANIKANMLHTHTHAHTHVD